MIFSECLIEFAPSKSPGQNDFLSVSRWATLCHFQAPNEALLGSIKLHFQPVEVLTLGERVGPSKPKVWPRYCWKVLDQNGLSDHFGQNDLILDGGNSALVIGFS